MTDAHDRRPYVIGISGASGVVMARDLVEEMLRRELPLALVASAEAKMVWHQEMDESWSEALARWREHPHFTDYGIGEMTAPIASGSYPTRGMAVVPCSMASVASLAHGMANNLLLRSADVCLKERRTLVIVPRETPLHAVHLENMTTLARMGVVTLPPHPPFYLKPQTVADVVGYMVGRILVALGVDEQLEDRYQYSGPGV